MSPGGGNGQISVVPPGFRFHPTDEELLYYYLRKKVSYEAVDLDVIKEVDLNKLEPWDLKDKCRIGSGIENEWYFFSHKDKKYPTGTRTNRATTAGFWKATGRDKAIYFSNSNSKKIGMRKTLVFYTGRAPHGLKTDWIMHEYRLDDHIDNHYNNNNAAHQVQEDGWVVCRVFRKKLCNNASGDNISSNGGFFQHDHQPITTQVHVDHHEEEAQELRDGHFPYNNNNNNSNPYIKLPSTGPTSTYGTDPRLQNLMMLNEHMHLPQLWSPESTIVADTNMSLLSSRPSCPHVNMISDASNHHHINHNSYLLRPMLTTVVATATAANNIISSNYVTHRDCGGGGDWAFLDKLLQASNAQNSNNDDSITTRFNYPNPLSLVNGASTDANTSAAQRSYTCFGTSAPDPMF